MGPSNDRREVVLAVGLKRYVAQHDHFVIARNLVECSAEIVARLLGIAREPFFIGAGDASRGSLQSLTIRVVAGPANEGADGILGLGTGRPVEGRRPRRLGVGTTSVACDSFSHV